MHAIRSDDNAHCNFIMAVLSAMNCNFLFSSSELHRLWVQVTRSHHAKVSLLVISVPFVHLVQAPAESYDVESTPHPHV